MIKLRIHYLQHVIYEGIACIEEWAKINNHSVTGTCFFKDQELPSNDDFDMLIVMGGGMSANDEAVYPWIRKEKEFIKEAIEKGKIVVGICLGSQMISSALGAKVCGNAEKEIGWFDITLTREAVAGELFKDLPEQLKVFHWHGETFDLPDGAVLLASSAACRNQAYIFGDRVLALQFHIEPTLKSINEMLAHGVNDLTPGRYVQSAAQLVEPAELITRNNEILFTLLNRLAGK